jgi:hypothetical protein
MLQKDCVLLVRIPSCISFRQQSVLVLLSQLLLETPSVEYLEVLPATTVQGISVDPKKEQRSVWGWIVMSVHAYLA